MSRHLVRKWVTDYVKERGLQDKADRRFILADDRLKSVFRVSRFNFFSLSRLIAERVTSPAEYDAATQAEAAACDARLVAELERGVAAENDGAAAAAGGDEDAEDEGNEEEEAEEEEEEEEEGEDGDDQGEVDERDLRASKGNADSQKSPAEVAGYMEGTSFGAYDADPAMAADARNGDCFLPPPPRRGSSSSAPARRGERPAGASSRDASEKHPMQLSSALSAVCGGARVLSRTEVERRVWHYVREHGLGADAAAGFACDAALGAVFGRRRVEDSEEVARGLAAHLTELPAELPAE
jgi:chromatin remodeling complex protein RSC6